MEAISCLQKLFPFENKSQNLQMYPIKIKSLALFQRKLELVPSWTQILPTGTIS